ncbi:MAG: crotonase/enoyl-CoA hydratase family protein [Hyphomicrobiales bacterium]|nr:crotonase/enoyl-CoA hydratase family protein [Hyphomicrobiales bacterium]
MSDIAISVSDGVQLLRLTRPAKKNALTADMYAALAAALEAGDADDDIAVHVFLGSEGVFTAGNDIADFMAAVENGRLDAQVFVFMRALVGSRKPIVAGVDGLAVGIGTTMLMHCDLAYASETAQFRTPFLDLGLIPEAGSSLLMPPQLGHVRAFELLCLGAPFDAEQALAAGLINRVLPAAELEGATLEAARAVAAKPRHALFTARQLLKGDRQALFERIEEEARIFEDCLKSPEAREAFQAFLEKRAPDFARARREAAQA